MSQNDGMVSDDVLERLKERIEDMKTECVKALDRISHSLPQHLHEHLQHAHQVNADLMQLGQLVEWQMALRQAAAKRTQDEKVLQ